MKLDKSLTVYEIFIEIEKCNKPGDLESLIIIERKLEKNLTKIKKKESLKWHIAIFVCFVTVLSLYYGILPQISVYFMELKEAD